MNTALQTHATLTRLPSLMFEDGRITIGSLAQFNGKIPEGWIWHESKAPIPRDRNYLGLAYGRALQRFIDNRPEVIGAALGSELPDVDELNEKIPKTEWPFKFGSTTERDPPWKKVYRLYMLDLADLRIVTFLKSTFGAIRAVTDVEDRWQWAQALWATTCGPCFG